MKSLAIFSTVRKEYMPYAREATKRRRWHALRMAMIRLRFINMFIHDEEKMINTFVNLPVSAFYNASNTLLHMICAMCIYANFDYCGPPDYLCNFAPEHYDTLANLMLSYDLPGYWLVYVSNVYGMMPRVPRSVLECFMFNHDQLLDEI